MERGIDSCTQPNGNSGLIAPGPLEPGQTTGALGLQEAEG